MHTSTDFLTTAGRDIILAFLHPSAVTKFQGNPSAVALNTRRVGKFGKCRLYLWNGRR